MSYEVVQAETFSQWLGKLRDRAGRARVISRLSRIGGGNFGDHKSVGGSVSELRIKVGPGYRVYYTVRESTVVILLCGGDKSSQQADIDRAHEIVQQLGGDNETE